jgi:chromosome segregation ATPase
MSQLNEATKKITMQRRNITHDLEQAARQLVAHMNARHGSDSIITSIEQEIAFTLEQIDRLQTLHKGQSKSLCKVECYVGTELIQMEARTPRYSPKRFPERDKLQNRLFAIEAERRKHSVFYEDRLQALQKQLLSLMQKHGHLDIRGRTNGLEELAKGGNAKNKSHRSA